MKTRNYLLFSLAFALFFSLNACKSKQSNYKAAYEAAKARESTTTDNVVVETTPVTKQPAATTATTATNVPVQKEKVTAVDGAGIQQFSVVIGSFINKTNATSLKERMSKQGYQAFLAQNESGMYRVIVATFSDKTRAVAERERIKSKYYSTSEFQDAWILDKQ